MYLFLLLAIGSLFCRFFQILFDNDKTRAIGIEIKGPNGATYTAKATREIVLSAGAVNSARILIQSGIGPHDHLDELEV